MLFDLNARGRRRTLKVVYASLALLMGGGLVLFGIGGNTSGGLFDAFRDEAGQLDDNAFSKRAEDAEKKAQAQPRNAAAWGEVARLRYQVATQSGNFDDQTGAYSEEGTKQLRLATAAWDRHLSLAGDKPDGRVAGLMFQAYVGLDDLPKAVSAFEVVVASRPEPTADLFAQLASYSYAAGLTRKGDLARTRALDLADKDERATLKAQLDSAKSQAQSSAAAEAGGATTAPSTTAPATPTPLPTPAPAG